MTYQLIQLGCWVYSLRGGLTKFANNSIISMKDLYPEGKPKLTSLFQNDRRYQRSTSITTSFETEEEIKKYPNLSQRSRIANLPNYKKDTLECRLDFVVVFQSIEIERLSVEIESLRVRLLDSERQIFNYKNYEVQIQELTERCFEYEKERMELQGELSRLRSILSQSEEAYREHLARVEDEMREKEDMMFKYRQELIMEKKQREESEDFRLKLESSIKQRDRAHSKQLRELEKSTTSFGRRAEHSKSEENLAQLVRKLQDQIGGLRQENSTLRRHYESLQQQGRDLSDRYQQVQDELANTIDQLRQKELELINVEHESRQRLQILQARYEDECNDKVRQLEDNQNEVAQWKNEADRLQGEIQRYQAKLMEYNEQSQKYEGLLSQAGDEIDRLNTIVRDKIKYLEAWQNRYQKLEKEHSDIEQELNSLQLKETRAQEEIARLIPALRHKTQALEKVEKAHETEINMIRGRMLDSDEIRGQLPALRKERESDKQEIRRQTVQNKQLKDQLNKWIQENNKLFEDLNRAEVGWKQTKAAFSAAETAAKQYQEDMQKYINQRETVKAKIDKLTGEKRALEEEVVEMKSLKEQLKHEQTKKNEYLREGKKLAGRFKESEKVSAERARKLAQKEDEIGRYKAYVKRMEEKNNYLQEKVKIISELKKEILLLQTNSNDMTRLLEDLKSRLADKIRELNNAKQKLIQYQKYVREFIEAEQIFKEELKVRQRLISQLKELRHKHEQLQDLHDQLNLRYDALEQEKMDLSIELTNMDKVVQINADEMKRVEGNLTELRQERTKHKQREKELLGKIKEGERRVKGMEGEMEKQRTRLSRQRGEFERQLEKKWKEYEREQKKEKQERDKALTQFKKTVLEKEGIIGSLSQQNKALGVTIRQVQQQKQRIYRSGKEIEKKMAMADHELVRANEQIQEIQKQLEIARGNNGKLLQRLNEHEEEVRLQLERMGGVAGERETLAAELSELRELLGEKERDIGHLKQECETYKKELAALYNELKEEQSLSSALSGEMIKLKYDSETITQYYSSLKKRIISLEAVVAQLKQNLAHSQQNHQKLLQEHEGIEREWVRQYDQMVGQLESMEERQFLQREEIIRLQTLNRILQIEVGQYKDRETAMFSIVEEASLIKQNNQLQKGLPAIKAKETNPDRMTATTKNSQVVSDLRNSEIIGEINITSRKSRAMGRLDEEDPQQRSPYGLEPIKEGKTTRVYFENIVCKNG